MGKIFVVFVAVIVTLAGSGAAQAGTRVVARRVMGHQVRVVTWRPHAGVRALVAYSRHARAVPDWANARHRTRIVAAINGGTWAWRTGTPIGTLWAGGRMVTRVQRRPAVGFLSSGAVVFGAKRARARGAGNIISGAAYLVRGGVPVRSPSDAPWAAQVQWSCGPRHTDGNGCWRSNVVRFRDGSFGLVEVAYASMPLAARILKRLGASDALTLDSGGSANMWTRSGVRGTCADRQAIGHCFGITHASGMRWERPVPDAIVVSLRRKSHRP